MRPEILDCLSSGALHLIIHPTEKCNFRCTYCYERFEIGRMPPDIVEGVQRLVAQRTDLHQLHIGWFGGEPLVALDQIRAISRSVQDHCRHHRIDYSADMTTNGYRLTRDVGRELIDLGVSIYQISLDGDAAHHDKTRLKANGDGTFDVIWSNISALLSTDWEFEILLRIHYHQENLASIERLIDQLVEAFPGETRLKLYFKNVSPLGSVNDADFPFVEFEKRREVVAGFAERVAGRLPVTEVQGGYICYACKPNSLVIRADGGISKCTVALYDDHNKIGHLRPDGSVEINEERLRPWVDALLAGTDNDRACPLKRVATSAAS